MSGEFTLCLIVKDEERFLGGCLESTADAATGVVVVDTGSRDRSVEIARAYGAEVVRAGFEDDFARARNVALERVRTPWIVFLDADERFEPNVAHALEPTLAHAPARMLAGTVLRYNFFATGGWFSGREVKVLRNDPRVRYERRINESVRGSVERAGGEICELPLILNHFGHCRPRRERDEKAHLYMRLMREQLAAKPDDAILVAFLGLILRTLGNFDEALEHARRATAMQPHDALVRLFEGHVLRASGDDAAARDAYLAAAALAPADGATWNMAGVQELALGRPAAARDAFERARDLDPLAVHVLINLGLVEQAEGRYAAAVDCFDAAADANPAFLHEEWTGRAEFDPFRELHYETITQYAGLGYHRAFCAARAAQSCELAGVAA
jgi:tetratricopeptide (TPR) repeat protein